MSLLRLLVLSHCASLLGFFPSSDAQQILAQTSQSLFLLDSLGYPTVSSETHKPTVCLLFIWLTSEPLFRTRLPAHSSSSCWCLEFCWFSSHLPFSVIFVTVIQRTNKVCFLISVVGPYYQIPLEAFSLIPTGNFMSFVVRAFTWCPSSSCLCHSVLIKVLKVFKSPELDLAPDLVRHHICIEKPRLLSNLGNSMHSWNSLWNYTCFIPVVITVIATYLYWITYCTVCFILFFFKVSFTRMWAP